MVHAARILITAATLLLAGLLNAGASISKNRVSIGRNASDDGYNWGAIYDGLGRRLKTVYQPVAAGVVTGTVTEVTSTYDPEVEFLEIETKQGSDSWRKLYGPDGEGQYGEHQGVGGLEAVIASGGAVSVPAIDYYGHVAGWVDGATLDYTAATRSLGYGPAPGETPSVLELTANYTRALAWQGRRIDPTGIIWLGARYYDSESGRFISTDPLGHAASLSLYDYADGDPVNRIDPTGRISTSFSNNPAWKTGNDSYLYTATALASGKMSDYTPIVHQYKEEPIRWDAEEVARQINRVMYSLPVLSTIRAGAEFATGKDLINGGDKYRGDAFLDLMGSAAMDATMVMPAARASAMGGSVVRSAGGTAGRMEVVAAAKAAGQTTILGENMMQRVIPFAE